MILVVAFLAVHRLTVLITNDSITERVRDGVAVRWLGRWPDTLVSCAWCASFHVAWLITLVLWLSDALTLPWAVWLLLPFAMSTVTGIIEDWR